MTTWGKKRIAGQVYDLSHLDPFVVDVTPKSQGAPTYKIRATFGSHTFTRALEPNDTLDLVFRDGAENRCFCTERHELSLNLPAIVQDAANGRAYFSQTHNFLLIENLEGLDDPYAVFFNLEKSRSQAHDAAMFIVSAYPKPNLPKRLPKITFATLVSKTIRGETVVRPKK